MAAPLVPLVVGFSNGLTPAAAPRLRPVAMMSGRPSLWEAYGSSEGGGSDTESTRDSSPPLFSPPPPPVSRPQPPCSPPSPPPVSVPMAYAAAAAAPVATKMDEDRRCTVCVALLGQYNKVEALLEGGCDGLCSTEDGTLDYSGFSALVDAVEVRCLGLG